MDVPRSHEDKSPNFKAFINPEIIERAGAQTFEEGCLSFPGITADVKRALNITVRYLDPHGVVKEDRLTGLASRTARMISSQHAKPPPRSLAHHHQPLRGVITTSGAALLSVPETSVTTLNACACMRSAWAVSSTFAPARAQSARKDAS